MHIACREGHLQVVQTLLEESQINAEAVTLKCRNPLHELAKHSKESAAAICEVFLETMPKYPLEVQDGEGNTGMHMLTIILVEIIYSIFFNDIYPNFCSVTLGVYERQWKFMQDSGEIWSLRWGDESRWYYHIQLPNGH